MLRPHHMPPRIVTPAPNLHHPPVTQLPLLQCVVTFYGIFSGVPAPTSSMAPSGAGRFPALAVPPPPLSCPPRACRGRRGAASGPRRGQQDKGARDDAWVGPHTAKRVCMYYTNTRAPTACFAAAGPDAVGTAPPALTGRHAHRTPMPPHVSARILREQWQQQQLCRRSVSAPLREFAAVADRHHKLLSR